MISLNFKDLFLFTILVLVVVASGIDLYTDLSHGVTGQHVAKEAAIMAIAALGIAWLLYGLHRQNKKISALRKELEETRQPAVPPSTYILRARRHLAEVVGQQFEEWELSASEKEVGLLLLKGLSLKEIAGLRNTLEKTVRQQASAIYKKADVAGRHAFAAWFIEDFL